MPKKTKKKQTNKKKLEVFSASKLQAYKGLTQFSKLQLSLCPLRWLKQSLKLVSTFR